MPWAAKLACSDSDYVKFLNTTLGFEHCQEVFRLSIEDTDLNGVEIEKAGVRKSEPA